MHTRQTTPSSLAHRALFVLTLGLLVGSLPQTAAAQLVVKAKAGPVAVLLDTGHRCGTCADRLVVTLGKPAVTVGRTSCGPTLVHRPPRRCAHQVWVPGHFKVQRHGHRTWIPGHWKRLLIQGR